MNSLSVPGHILFHEKKETYQNKTGERGKDVFSRFRQQEHINNAVSRPLCCHRTPHSHSTAHDHVVLRWGSATLQEGEERRETTMFKEDWVAHR